MLSTVEPDSGHTSEVYPGQYPEGLNQSENDEEIKYFVNGEEVTHSFHKPPDRKIFELTVREILASAGFTPAEDYELTRDADHHTYVSLDKKVPVENGEKFTATYKGPTPAS